MRATGIFAGKIEVFGRCFSTGSVKDRDMFVQNLFRKADEHTVDSITFKLSMVMNRDHVIDKTPRKNVRIKSTIAAVSSAVNFPVFLDFPVEFLSVLVEEVKMSFRKTKGLRDLFEIFRNMNFSLNILITFS